MLQALSFRPKMERQAACKLSVITFRKGAVSRDARLEYLLLVNRFPPKPAQTYFCGRWRSANECVRLELR